MKVELVIPNKNDFFQLYRTTGWESRVNLGEDKLIEAVRNSWYMVSVYDDDKLVGFGRIISDGVFQAFICDVVVLPEYQRRGIGTKIVKTLLKRCDDENILSVKLFASTGKSKLYKKLGFMERNFDSPGMWWIDREVIYKD